MTRDFKGIWIPREIWLSKDLSMGQKVLLAEIDSLCTKEEGCWASNEYLAEFLGISLATLKRSLKALKDGGYLVESGWKNSCRVWRTKMTRLKMSHDMAQNDGSTRLKMSHKKSNDKYKRSQKGVHTPTPEKKHDPDAVAAMDLEFELFKREKGIGGKKPIVESTGG